MLRKIHKNELEIIRSWRNSPDVRKNMFTDHLITADEHLVWWQSLNSNNSQQCLMFVRDGIAAGVVNFFDIDKDNHTCHWGFYLSNDFNYAKNAFQNWQLLEQEAIQYAFNELNCQKLYCETFRFNQPVLEMHKRFGFVETAIEQRKKGDVIEEVVITVLNSEDVVQENKSPSIRFQSCCMLMGSSNLDFIKNAFQSSAKHYSIDLQIADIPYGQYQIAANDPSSPIYTSYAAEMKNNSAINGYVIFLERIEDFLPLNSILSCQILDELISRWQEYLNFIRHFRSKVSGVFIIANAASVSHWITSSDPTNDERKKIALALNKMRQELETLCGELHDSHILDMDGLIKDTGRLSAHPGKYWYLARAPFSSILNDYLSEKIIALMMAIEAQNARVIVLDLDDTLWSGVIGDDGMEGIAVDGDYPANVFQNIQAIMLNYRQRGLLLALCSKNNEQTALEVFKRHPGMLLSLDDLTAWRINWNPKSDNLIELSEELGLPLSSFCMIDDNPVEREAIRHRLPEVFVPELPEEISEWPEIIKRLPELADIGISDEDTKRAQQYKIRAKINKVHLSDDSRTDFLDKLDMSLSFELLSDLNQQRVLQLINKTSQFNTTSRRYKKAQFELFNKTGFCYAIRLTDRLGSDEIIGVLMFTIESSASIIIDTFLLSCRVLGRDIERAALAWLYHYAKERGLSIIRGEIIPTERNTPVRDLYSKLGFQQREEYCYEMNIIDKSIPIPGWITLKNNQDLVDND